MENEERRRSGRMRRGEGGGLGEKNEEMRGARRANEWKRRR